MGWEVGGRSKKDGTYVYLWLIHVDVWQKPTQYCKTIIIQLQINNFFFKGYVGLNRTHTTLTKNSPVGNPKLHQMPISLAMNSNEI